MSSADTSPVQVSINRFTLNPLGIKELSSFSSMFVAQHLRITPESKHHPEERLVVGDGMRSVFVLDVDMGSGEVYGDQRDMATHQVMGMEGVRDGGEGVIISDVSGCDHQRRLGVVIVGVRGRSVQKGRGKQKLSPCTRGKDFEKAKDYAFSCSVFRVPRGKARRHCSLC